MAAEIRSAAPPPGARPAGRRGLVLLVLLALLVDFNGLPGTFVGDDIPLIARDPRIAALDVRAIFTTDYWGAGNNSGNYRPLTLLSFAVGRRLFGDGALSHHVVNVLLHAGVTLFFARALLVVGFAFPLAWTAAALFAVHPIHVDSVAILVGRSELLVALFVFIGLRAALAPGRRTWPLVLGSYAAALLSKEHAVVFLPLLALADAFRAPAPPDSLKRRLPLYALLLALTAGWILLRHQLFLSTGIGPHATYTVDNPLAGAPILARLFTAIRVNLDYAIALIAPLGLQSTYSGPGLKIVPGPFSAGGALALAWAASLLAAAVHGWRRRAGYGLGIPWFIAAFSVTSNFFFLMAVLRADRFAYLPNAGFCLAAAGLLLAASSRLARARIRPPAGLIPAACILALALISVHRNTLFRDPVRLWESSIRADPRNARAWASLAQVHWDAGRFEEAERSMRSAIDADPSFPDIYAGYALFLVERGRYAEAESAAARGIESLPGAIGLAHLARTQALVELGRPAEALALLERIAARFDQHARYWSLLGRVREGFGEQEAAVAAYRRALLIGADRDTFRRLAGLLLVLDRPAEAEKVLLSLLPNAPRAAEWNLFGVALALQGRREEAGAAFAEAIRLAPLSEEYRKNLERASAPGPGSPPGNTLRR